jgi:transposase
MTSNSKSEGRFGKQDFVYVGADDIYLCPASERLSYRYGRVTEPPKEAAN